VMSLRWFLFPHDVYSSFLEHSLLIFDYLLFIS
jgi:hypothetical protein